MKEATPMRNFDDGWNKQFHTCPVCGVLTDQVKIPIANPWSDPRTTEVWGMKVCRACANVHLWIISRSVSIGGGAGSSVSYNAKVVYPMKRIAPLANPDMPEDVKRDYEEAAAIQSQSPRGAAALLRLCIQKLCIHLGEPGKILNDDIKSLAKKGLLPEVQQSLDAVRVIGNNAVHPGQIDLDDRSEVVVILFSLVNIIVQRMISDPKASQEAYMMIPLQQREAIERRDAI